MDIMNFVYKLLLAAGCVVATTFLQANADDFKFVLGDQTESNPVSSFYEQEQAYREFKRECLMRGYDEKVAADAAFVEGCEELIKDETEGLDKLAAFEQLREERKVRCEAVDEAYKDSIAAWKEAYKERRAEEYRAYERYLSAYIDVRASKPIGETLATAAVNPQAEGSDAPSTDASATLNHDVIKEMVDASVAERLAAVDEEETSDANESLAARDVRKLVIPRESGLVYVPGSVGDNAKMHVRGKLKKCARFWVGEVNEETETGVAFDIEMQPTQSGKKRARVSLDPVAVFKYSDEYIEERIAEEIEKLK